MAARLCFSMTINVMVHQIIQEIIGRTPSGERKVFMRNLLQSAEVGTNMSVFYAKDGEGREVVGSVECRFGPQGSVTPSTLILRTEQEVMSIPYDAIGHYKVDPLPLRSSSKPDQASVTPQIPGVHYEM